VFAPQGGVAFAHEMISESGERLTDTALPLLYGLAIHHQCYTREAYHSWTAWMEREKAFEARRETRQGGSSEPEQ
jgi:hypothetical protein